MPKQGRPSCFPIQKVATELLREKSTIVEDGVRITHRQNPIWKVICERVPELTNKRGEYLAAIVQMGRYNFHDILGISTQGNEEMPKEMDNEAEGELLVSEPLPSPEREDVSSSEECSSSSEEDDDPMEPSSRKEFSMTLSKEEWKTIEPEEVTYPLEGSRRRRSKTSRRRVMYVLKRNTWTNVINSHFFDLLRLPCKLKCWGGKVYTSGNAPYTRIHGLCSGCGSKLAGVVEKNPEAGERVVIQCTYEGPFTRKHLLEKRQLRGSIRQDAVRQLVTEHKSATFIRHEMAAKVMIPGEPEPPILPSSRSLHQAKYEALQRTRLDSDPILALVKAKYSLGFNDFLKDISYDRFYVHFWSTAQIHTERLYCQSTPESQISIDASGGVVKRLQRPNSDESKHILLYEVVINDKMTKKQYPVCGMLSERHDTETIRHWLNEWRRDGAVVPKMVVTDMSLALMNACLQSFADISSLQSYLHLCSDALLKQLVVDLPGCYVRNDVAHTLKLISSFPALKGCMKRTRHFFIRSIALIVTATSIEDIRIILKHILTVALSETEGHLDTGEETPCEVSKRFLQRLIAGDTTDEDQFACSPFNTKTSRLAPDESHNTKFGYEFREFAQEVQCQVMQEVMQPDGDRGNQQFLPSIVKDIVKIFYLLPLWSAVMAPLYGVTSVTASSSASEKHFNTVKTHLFQHISLPTRLDDFVLQYVRVLSGSQNLSSVPKENIPTKCKETKDEEEETSDRNCDETPTAAETASAIDRTTTEFSEQEIGLREKENLEQKAEADVAEPGSIHPVCPDCPSMSTTMTCGICGLGVHNREECSVLVKAEEGDPICLCLTCSRMPEKEKSEILAMNEKENWRGVSQSSPKRKRTSYLVPNSEWNRIDLSVGKPTVPIGLLKNGNSSNLKPIKFGRVNYVFSNTCPFDSLFQIMCAAYCDSDCYKDFIDQAQPDRFFAKMVTIMTTKGVSSSQLYRLRGLFLKDNFHTKTELTVIKVLSQCNVSTAATKIFKDYPSIEQTSLCTSGDCPEPTTKSTVPVITIGIQHGQLSQLEERVKRCTDRMVSSTECLREIDVTSPNSPSDSERITCNGQRSSERTISKHHLLLEVIEQGLHIAECGLTLKDVPSQVAVDDVTYTIRGVVGYSNSNLKIGGVSELGHYRGYCCRPDYKWEVYDDLGERKADCTGNESIRSHLLVYTV